MRKLVLNKSETKQLLRDGVLLIKRNGFEVLIGLNIEDDDYKIKIINPYDEVVLQKELWKWVI